MVKRKLTKIQLIEELIKLKDNPDVHRGDPETQHADADDLLLEYINDADVTEAYEAIEKWYA